MTTVAGILLAEGQGFVSPADMACTRSDELPIMVVLGGAGTLYGPLLGTFAFLSLELVLEGWTAHGQAALGALPRRWSR